MEGVKKMKFIIFLLSMGIFLKGCGSNDEPEEIQEETTIEGTETQEPEEIEAEEEPETIDEVLATLPDPLSIEETRWYLGTSNTDAQREFTLHADVYPIVHNNEYAILPITFDSDDEQDLNIDNLLGGSAIGSGEGLSNVQGYEVRLVDPNNLLVYHIGVVDNDLHEGALQLTHPHLNVGADQEEPVHYYAIFEAPETEEISLMIRQLGFYPNIPVIEDPKAFDVLVAHYAEIEEEQVPDLFENV
jgi:hypothetical protein